MEPGGDTCSARDRAFRGRQRSQVDLGARPQEGRETWMGGLSEEGKEMPVPKCSQALFTGLSSGSLENSSSLIAGLETIFFIWDPEGGGRDSVWGRTPGRALALRRRTDVMLVAGGR